MKIAVFAALALMGVLFAAERPAGAVPKGVQEAQEIRCPPSQKLRCWVADPYQDGGVPVTYCICA